MEPIILLIIGIIIVALIIKLLSWLAEIIMKVVVAVICIVVLLILFEVPIPPEITEQLREGFAFLQQQFKNINLAGIKEKIIALLKLGREYLNG